MAGTTVRVTDYLGSVPQCWPGETVVCLASGPSLTRDDVEYCRGKARTIVVNSTLQIAPWADVFFASDGRVWRWNEAAIRAFQGMKFSLDPVAAEYGGMILRNGGVCGLSRDPRAVCTGYNSGYMAVNVAVLLGAARILLLGYDMQQGPSGESHWHGDHVNKAQPPYADCVRAFRTMVEPLKAAGVEVVNCTRSSALTMFDRADLREALV